MSSADRSLSEVEGSELPSAEAMSFGIVVSEWNSEITDALYQGAIQTLVKAGAHPENIHRHNVPGTFELPLGAQYLLEFTEVDAVICIGCVIQGETRHFDFICQAAADGIMQISLKYNQPVIFGVLTTNDMTQARERAGGRHGNKGDEAAITAIKMINYRRSIS
jgi:6,7-dimethyl-8-ribityllumazine synthase